jgi:hypothetical protein
LHPARASFWPRSNRRHLDPELRSQIRPEEGNQRDDVVIHFGALAMLMGKAFPLNDDSGFNLGGQLTSDQGTPVLKQWTQTPDGGRYLIESVSWSEVLPQMKSLPVVAEADMPQKNVTLKRTWPAKIGQRAERKPVEVAKANYEPKGYALDFVIVPDQQPQTFLSGETYVSRTTYYNGTSATFQPGCIIKRWADNGAALVLYGNISFPDTTQLCVFTTIDDDSYGGHFPGNANPYLPQSDGDPSNVYEDALKIWYVNYSTLVRSSLFRWAVTGIDFFSTGASANHTVSNCRFEWLVSYGVSVAINSARVVTLNNSTKSAVFNDSYVSPGGGSVSGSLTLDCKEASFPMDQLQHETAVAIDPTNPQYVVLFGANVPLASNGSGILQAKSTDGGITWGPAKVIAGGGPGDLPPGRNDEQTAFDQYGNLFLVYDEYKFVAGPTNIHLALSTDRGANWTLIKTFSAGGNLVDRPVLATGPGPSGGGSVWVMYLSNDRLMLAGATVSGLGNVGTFSYTYEVPSSGGSSHGDPISTGLAVGPAGQVAMAYETRTEPTTADRKILVSIDSDGIGGNPATTSIPIQVNMGWKHKILAQFERGVFRCPVLAWDRHGNGNKLYLAYTDTPPTDPDGNNTDIYIRSASSPYTSFSSALKVNDDTTSTSQFFAGLAVDQTSGRVALSWYDCRNDPAGNRLTQFFGAVSNTGFAPQAQNFQLTVAQSDGSINTSLGCGPQGLDACCAGSGLNYGDYTGLAFHAGLIVPVWCSYVGTGHDRCGDTHVGRLAW